jgi:hypothetical protein
MFVAIQALLAIALYLQARRPRKICPGPHETRCWSRFGGLIVFAEVYPKWPDRRLAVSSLLGELNHACDDQPGPGPASLF